MLSMKKNYYLNYKLKFNTAKASAVKYTDILFQQDIASYDIFNRKRLFVSHRITGKF